MVPIDPLRIPRLASRAIPDPMRQAGSDDALCLNRVLGDLGSWLEETERHRKRRDGIRTVN